MNSTSITTDAGFIYIQNNSGTIQYRIDNSIWTNITWPVTITNTNSSNYITVLFTTNITLSSANNYFICNSNNIQFGDIKYNNDGTRPIITLNNIVGGYPGLIQCLNYGKINIFNLVVDGSTSVLATSGGWIAQQSFAQTNNTNYIINCKSIGDIPNNSGGIVGSLSVYNGSQLYIIGCNSTGNINFSSGGIIGSNSCVGSGSLLTISQSFSSGSINNNGGGICGNSCGINNGQLSISKCYSTGTIGQNSGGIIGHNAGSNGLISINNSYSTGTIGTNGGGICGTYAGSNSGSATVTNCYSTGTIGINSGGIFGQFYGDSGGSAVAFNCYTSGSGTNGGIFSGSLNANPTNSSNNYYETINGWNNENALITLQGIGTSSWISLLANNPYVILNMGSTPYSLTNINISDYTLINSYTNPSTIIQGQSTSSSIISGYSTFILLGNYNASISINSSNGTIITSSTTTPNTYTLIIYANSDYTTSLYLFTTSSLSIESNCNNDSLSTLPLCCQVNNPNPDPQTTNYDSNVITNKHSSKAVDLSVDIFYRGISTGQRTAYSQPIFKSYHDYILFLQGKLR
jgi:hypothetical protein